MLIISAGESDFGGLMRDAERFFILQQIDT